MNLSVPPSEPLLVTARRVLLILLVALGTLIAPAGPAQAHAALVGATPTPGSVIGSSLIPLVILLFRVRKTVMADHLDLLKG